MNISTSDTSEVIKLLMMNTFGLSIIYHTLRKASKYNLTMSSGQSKEVNDCYAFVQGTGLDIVLKRFSIEYSSEKIRDGFNYFMRNKNGKH